MTGVLNSGAGKEEPEEQDACVSVVLRESGEVERRLSDGRLEVSYQNGNKKIIREGAGVREGEHNIFWSSASRSVILYLVEWRQKFQS